MASVPRHPAVAGQFYEGDLSALRRQVDACFADPRGPGPLRNAPKARQGRRMRAAVVPHAGLPFSGPIAAHAYAELAADPVPEAVLILGVDHHGIGPLAALSLRPWHTPLGDVPIASDLARALTVPPVTIDEAAHALEHSIEVQLPFLERVVPGVPFVPLQIHYAELDALRRVARIVQNAVRGRDVVVLASSDFTHYRPAEVARALDEEMLARILARDGPGLYRLVRDRELSMCGIAPVTVLLEALADEPLTARLLRYGHSGEAAPMREVVGYASIAFERDLGPAPSAAGRPSVK